MTCIVGIVNKNGVTMAADSAGISHLDIRIRKDPKMFKNGEFVIGCTTSFRMIQLLKYSFKPPEIKPETDIFEYMCTSFVNEIRSCFKKGGYLQKDTDGDEKGGCFLVAYKDRLFRIENDFQVAENVNGMDSIGCGADYALGSLYSSQKFETSYAERVRLALSAAATFSAGVAEPFHLIETETDEKFLCDGNND